MNDLGENKLNLRQLNAINFIVGTFANITDVNNIDEPITTEIITENINKYLDKIPYGKAKDLINFVINAKDIIKTL